MVGPEGLGNHVTVTSIQISEGWEAGTRSQGPVSSSSTIGFPPLHPICDPGPPKARGGYSDGFLLPRHKVYSRKTKPVSFYMDITYLAKLWGCEGKTRT